LISIQGGGNELVICEFSPVVPDPEQCLDDYLPKVTASLETVVAQLRSAGYHGRIVLVSYYPVPGLRAPLRRLNQAIAGAATGRHVAFANASALFDAYARDHHGDLCTTGLLIKLPDGSCDLHPTRIGQGLLANAVLEAAHE